MRYGVKFTSYRIKSVSNSLDQTVGMSNILTKANDMFPESFYL